ncbi:hypothetical protein PILCRDRAFT_815570 [Piloderma croceum F 1598]|uniref:Uncharacterized protein n=1 Tax=Piloderma croceum (strain F 1598) TaxID=765440 RepID=A0A0C3G5S0_PILCF|nr:hypothetical protein PILCRDRAFT_815570 [Piloderma croceum F 1598]
MRLTTPLTLLAAAAAATPVAGGPLAYAACQTGKYVRSKTPDVIWSHTPSSLALLLGIIIFGSNTHLFEGCNGLAVACYAAAGFTFGVTIVAVPPAIMGCNIGLGTCMATCATVGLFAPTP